jgi:hypothetical protein
VNRKVYSNPRDCVRSVDRWHIRKDTTPRSATENDETVYLPNTSLLTSSTESPSFLRNAQSQPAPSAHNTQKTVEKPCSEDLPHPLPSATQSLSYTFAQLGDPRLRARIATAKVTQNAPIADVERRATGCAKLRKRTKGRLGMSVIIVMSGTMTEVKTIRV